MKNVIHILNPNSSEEVSARIAWAAKQASPLPHPMLKVSTLQDGPRGIVSQEDVDRVAPLVVRFISENVAEASAFVIACFSDPGLQASRKATAKPVIGIGEAGLNRARAFGERIGVVAIASTALERHYRYYGQIGMLPFVCGERAIDLMPAESGNEDMALDRIVRAASNLRDDDKAQVVVLGCAGMAQLRESVEAALGIPVVDPCEAAVRQAVDIIAGA